MRLFAKYLTAALLAVAMLALSLGTGASGAAAAPAADTLPATTCALSGGVQVCELWAKQGTFAVGTDTVNIWGYSSTSAGAPSIPGPTLIVDVNQPVRIELNNSLGNGQRTSLAIAGMGLPADMQGATDGGAAQLYEFTPDRPGTYVYEAGILSGLAPGELNGPRQVAMGLSGVLIVRSADGSAYGTPATAYDDEALLAYSEIDPAYNADPANFVLQNFNPTYLLINGKVAPATDMINVPAGHTVLLRNANLGMQFHSFGLLGLRQTIIADDGGPLPTASSLYARSLGSGQTMDSLVAVPGSAPDGTLYPLYETGMPGYGPAGPNGMGGMLTFIHVGIPAGDVTAPLVTAALAPASTDGSVDVTLDATADDSTTGGSFISSAVYSIDGGAPVAFPVAGTNVSETLSATLLGADLAALGDGPHTVTVSASDAAGNSASTSATVTVSLPNGGGNDLTAPAVAIDSLPGLSNSATTVALAATATDNVGVASASYTIDGVTTPLILVPGSPVSLNADIDVSGLADGTYQVDVTASDAAANSTTASASITLDRTAPVVTGGTSPATVALGAPVQLSATLSDATSTITGASYAWDGGTPVALSAQDGAFDSQGESILAAIDTAGLGEGPRTLTVSATDAAGNVSSADFTVTISDQIFADGFESGNRSAWSQAGGAARLSVNPAAALEGNFGLSSTGSSFVRKNLAANETKLQIGFYLDPNSQVFTGAKTVFRAMNGNTEAFRLQLRLTGGGDYQVRVLVRNSNTTANTGWHTINDGSNTIEMSWESGASVDFVLKVNGLASNLSQPVTTTAYTVNNLRLGAQSSGIGAIYVDGFKATRNTAIFP